MVTVILGNSNSQPSSLERELSQKDASSSRVEGEGPPLISGLPDDLALQCLARIPRWQQSRCKLVCKGWRKFLESELLFNIRRAHGVAEEWLYIFSSDPSVSPAEVYDPRVRKWRRLPPMPSEPFTYGLSNFECIAVDHSLLVIGGVLFDARAYPTDQPVASARVYKYDAVTNMWSRMADMHHARGSFACAVFQGKVIVAGGGSRHAQFSAGGSRLASAEMFDPQINTWEMLPSMSDIRAGCAGFIIDTLEGPRFQVMGGYGESHTIHGILSVDEYRRDGEAYDFFKRQWSRLANMWHELEGWKLGPVTQLDGEVYMLKGNSVLKYNANSNTWLRETNVARAEDKPGFFGLNGELHLVPTETSWTSRPLPRPQHMYNPRTKRWRSARVEGFVRHNSWNSCAKWGTTAVLSL